MYGAAGGFFDQQIAMDQIARLMGKEYLDTLKAEYGIEVDKGEDGAEI